MDVRAYKLERGEEVPTDPLSSAELESDLVAELADAAGVDKYVASVAYGKLSSDWRGHAAGALVVQHQNSSGRFVHVQDLPASTASPTPPATSPAPPPSETKPETGSEQK